MRSDLTLECVSHNLSGDLHAKIFSHFIKISRFPMIHELLLEFEIGLVGTDTERIININDQNDNVLTMKVNINSWV